MAAKKGKKIRERHASDRIFNAAVIILSITTFIVIAYPLWFIVIASISNSNMVNQGKVILWPVDIRFYGYQQILDDSRIWTGYLNTLIYVVDEDQVNQMYLWFFSGTGGVDSQGNTIASPYVRIAG